ncbi:hypothetical protein MKEN_01020600 [Mycena kentingensis (nom. inval.)]|nr:hypothetical protein MKEN_01020600 [Mycena kentingensis (nom. inval.)]
MAPLHHAKRAIADVFGHFSPRKKRQRSPAADSPGAGNAGSLLMPMHSSPPRAAAPPTPCTPTSPRMRSSTPPSHTTSEPAAPPSSPLKLFVDAILGAISPSRTRSASRISRNSYHSDPETPTRRRHPTTPFVPSRQPTHRDSTADAPAQDLDDDRDSFESDFGESSIIFEEDGPDPRPVEDIDDPPPSDDEDGTGVGQADVFGALPRLLGNLDARRGKFVPAPSVKEAEEACKGIDMLLRPRRGKKAYKANKFKKLTERRLEAMRGFLRLYIRRCKEGGGVKPGMWTAASKDAAVSANYSIHWGRNLRQWCRSMMEDMENIPLDNYGKSGLRASIDDEDISFAVIQHIQTAGKFFSAKDIMRFTGTPEMLERLGRTKPISIWTARRWLLKMGYRFKKRPRGLYMDGHEREDVVEYRQNVFVPIMEEIKERMRRRLEDGTWGLPPGVERAIVLWHQDESTFYQNDQRMVYWIPPDDPCKPLPKGEGYSIMVNGIVSADYGWLDSEEEKLLVLFRAGKNRDGYYTNAEVVAHFTKAAKLARKLYPQDEHIFMYDNAPTHLARPENGRSALKMSR